MTEEHDRSLGALATPLRGEEAWLALDRWHISYVPGDWLVAAGPRCVVFMRRQVGIDQTQLELLWTSVFAGASLEEAAETLNGGRLAQLSDVAMATLTPDGVRCLLRGAVRAVDAKSSQLLARGGASLVWCDVVLSSLYLRLTGDEDFSPSAERGPELPLSVGAAQCDAVFVDMRDATLTARRFHGAAEEQRTGRTSFVGMPAGRDDAPTGVDDDDDALDGEDIDEPANGGLAEAGLSEPGLPARPWGRTSTEPPEPEQSTRELRAPEPSALEAAAEGGAVAHDRPVTHDEVDDDSSPDGLDGEAEPSDGGGERSDEAHSASGSRSWGNASPEVMREMGLVPGDSPMASVQHRAESHDPGRKPGVVGAAESAGDAAGAKPRNDEGPAGPDNVWPPSTPHQGTETSPTSAPASPWFEESTGFAVGQPSAAEAFMFEPTQAIPDQQALPVMNPSEDSDDESTARGKTGGAGGQDARGSSSAQDARPSLTDELLGGRGPSGPQRDPFGEPISGSIDLNAPTPVVGSAQGQDPDQPPAWSFSSPTPAPNPSGTQGGGDSDAHMRDGGLPATAEPSESSEDRTSDDADAESPGGHGVAPDLFELEDVGEQPATNDVDNPQPGDTSSRTGFDGGVAAEFDDARNDVEPTPTAADQIPEPAAPPVTASGTIREPAVDASAAESAQALRDDLLGAEPSLPIPDMPAPATPAQHQPPHDAELSSQATIAQPSIPLLGIVTAENRAVPLSQPVVIGRSPVVGDPGEQAVKVPSPGHEISRTHLRIEQRGDVVEVTDLNSTNGTTVNMPGRSPIHLGEGASMIVPVGSVLDLGSGENIRIEASGN